MRGVAFTMEMNSDDKIQCDNVILNKLIVVLK
jgi:hypothetical protein